MTMRARDRAKQGAHGHGRAATISFLSSSLYCSPHAMYLASTSTTSSYSSFQPPTLFSFPPFFTLQPNPATLKTQLTAWSTLVESYCRSTRTFYLSADGGGGQDSTGVTTTSQLWGNAAIDRRLDSVGRQRVLQFMVEQGRAVWENTTTTTTTQKQQPQVAGQQRALILWRKPEEWGRLIRDWIVSTGQDKSIMTFFELTEGEMVEGQGKHPHPLPHVAIVRADAFAPARPLAVAEFANLPSQLLRLALQSLVAKGQAQIFQGSERGEGMEGVKFS